MLVPKENMPAIVTGDFNTVDIAIKKAFPELRIGEKMQSLVNYDGRTYQPKYMYNTQIEYILASMDFRVVSAYEVMEYSDHPFLVAEVEM
jgi:endonuclease/exonuclease/phosphatase family metal-dependent hydrolase